MKKIVIFGLAVLGLCIMKRWSAPQTHALPNCATGQYYTGSTCVACLTGNYCPNNDTMYQCTWWTYSSATGASSCLSCSPGSYSATGAASCTYCSSGTYEATWWATSCVPCIAGTYMGNTWSMYCIYCSPGSFSDAWASSCSTCDPGRYAATGAASCSQCDPWTYSATWAMTCTNCSPWTFAANAGSNQCSSCPANTFSNTSAASLCVSCGNGSISPWGATACTFVGWGVGSYVYSNFVPIKPVITITKNTNNLKNAMKKKIKRIIKLWKPRDR